MSEPQSIDEARRAIEHTRGRISVTLDQIEERLDEKKAELKQKTDVVRQVREHPWAAVGVAFGMGLAMGRASGRRAHRRRSRREQHELTRHWREEREGRLHELADWSERAFHHHRPMLKHFGRDAAHGVARRLRQIF